MWPTALAFFEQQAAASPAAVIDSTLTTRGEAHCVGTLSITRHGAHSQARGRGCGGFRTL
eukprot:6205390-Pleurochrysis_carterae.AAC.1